ncbi:MAG TPA: ribonuclease D [Gemmatimonadales bacterium]|jgi:ribonuclease D|nr:ribonuclease D [Gemmatimonadales bacterium]
MTVPVRLVDRPETFRALLDEVAGAPLVALDTEAASFHRFHDRIYLVQLSTRDLTAVIDPLGVGDLTPIGTLLADPAIETIFHDADYDLRLFDKEFGFRAKSLFDTRIAAQFLNEPGIGLGALLAKYFGVTADKRFQRADWSARPLSGPMLDYAAGDTVHLCELRDILLEQLDALGRTEWVAEEFENLEKIRWTGGGEGPETAFLRLKGSKALQRRELAILRELYNWREETSSRLDRASFRVLGNEVLFALAQQPVTTLEELGRVKGVGQDGAQRRGNEILAAIGRGLALPDRDLPRVERQQRRVPDPAFEARVEALKRRRNALAEELQLAPGVLCPNGTLEAIARAEPSTLADMATIPELRRWQIKVLGPALLEATVATG